MSDLYSITSPVEGNHTAITGAISDANVISCTRLRSTALRAIDVYMLDHEHDDDKLLERVRLFGELVVGATAQAVDFVDTDEDLSDDAPTFTDDLEPLRLLTYREEDAKVDSAITAILESMPWATVVNNPKYNATTWLFRISTKNSNINLISHITRQDMSRIGTLGTYHVTYKQTFGGFEVEPTLID